MPQPQMHTTPACEPVLRELGLDAESVFNHPQISVWRDIPERQNATLDAHLADGTTTRLHIKRFKQPGIAEAEAEARGIELLQSAGIDSAPLMAWGCNAQGLGFVISEDLAGYEPADRLIEHEQATFEDLLEPTAMLSAKLHDAKLHHRDLYLCHFFVRQTVEALELALIDAARVRKLPLLRRQRWIVKDLSQFWYSTLRLPVSDAQREQWLTCYASERGISPVFQLKRSVQRKAAWIGRHDAKLNRAQPSRNVSLED